MEGGLLFNTPLLEDGALRTVRGTWRADKVCSRRKKQPSAKPDHMVKIFTLLNVAGLFLFNLLFVGDISIVQDMPAKMDPGTEVPRHCYDQQGQDLRLRQTAT
ncbi:MAG: hypothetical protein IPI95_05320 [Flavobacteriales bacterium]|nr:hypothetical protein [Flavobacteriales bacterium]